MVKKKKPGKPPDDSGKRIENDQGVNHQDELKQDQKRPTTQNFFEATLDTDTDGSDDTKGIETKMDIEMIETKNENESESESESESKSKSESETETETKTKNDYGKNALTELVNAAEEPKGQDKEEDDEEDKDDDEEEEESSSEDSDSDRSKIKS